jgi:hypothetical protein
MLPRRRFVQSIGAVAIAAAAPMALRAQGSGPMVEVWKDPNCGCCKDWVAHMQSSGFVVRVNDSGNTAARARLGIPQQLGSCHTALVGGYAVEGHVPAREVRRLLKERPDAIGLSVPGMPVGSPGMDAPAYAGRTDPFDVLLVRRDGQARVYQSYNKS